MGSKKRQGNGSAENNESTFFCKIKDAAIIKDSLVFLGWITAFLFVTGICWVLTQPVRNRFLVKAVNLVFEQSGDPRRLLEPLPEGKGAFMFMGHSFDMESEQGERTQAVVFSFVGEGIFFPCVAEVSRSGEVKEFIPLTKHGEKILQRISPGIIGIYTRRIERGFKL